MSKFENKNITRYFIDKKIIKVIIMMNKKNT